MRVLERHVVTAVTEAENLRWFEGYLKGLLDGGMTKDELERTLQRVHEILVARGEEKMADLVLDGLDLLTGWCGPGMALSG